MGTTVNVVFGANLQRYIEQHRVALEQNGYSVGATRSSSESERRPTVGLTSSENAVSELAEWRRSFAVVRPVLFGRPNSFFDSSDLALATAPVLTTDAPASDLLRILSFLSRDDRWLLHELSELGSAVTRLIADETCAWIRSRPGILGLVQFGALTPAAASTILLQRLIQHAYVVLDGLPQDKLSIADIWNVTLLISVPLQESERDQNTSIGPVLDRFARDVNGSRKIILWLDKDLGNFFGPLGKGQAPGRINADDPLRQTLDKIAANPVERDALEVVFKKRLSQDDIDRLLMALTSQ
jgi:hypothetical protein